MTAPVPLTPGASAVVLGAAAGAGLFRDIAALASGAALELELVPAIATMVDGVVVRSWAFRTGLAAGGVELGARLPGPTLFVTEGETLRVRIRNAIASGGPHAFSVPGVVDSGPLAFGEERELTLVAPAAGTYLYLDPLNAPVNRVMGLFGALVVLPPPAGNHTPYSAPSREVARLFDDLGADAAPGARPWDRDRNAVWLFGTVDPSSHLAAAQSAAPLAPSRFRDAYLPRYLTVGGTCGVLAARRSGGGLSSPRAGAGCPRAAGRPCLLRTLNAGMTVRSPHVHGTHVHALAMDGRVLEAPAVVDAWSLPPLARKDLLLRAGEPPDVPSAPLVRLEPDLDDVLLMPPRPADDRGERARPRPPGVERGAPWRAAPLPARASGSGRE